MPANQCPKCSAVIATPQQPNGMWSGQKNGKPAGGAVYFAKCHHCAARLIAMGNAYDEAGRLRNPPPIAEDLAWRVDTS